MAEKTNPPRTAREVIDQAVKEGRIGLALAYVAIATAMILGVASFVQAFLANQLLWAVGGGGLGLWIWPALRYALKIRQENLAIRLLEIPLSDAQNADEAAKLLQEYFKNMLFAKGSP